MTVKMLILCLIIVFLVQFSHNFDDLSRTEVEDLYENFIENLKFDPFLLGEKIR